MRELNEYQKLDWISFAIQEAMNGNPNELDKALEFVEELRDLHGEEEEKLSAIDGLIVRRIKHHQEMKDGVKSGMARKRENYKLHVLSETLGEIRKIKRKRADAKEQAA